jgi:hypothetical protein
LRLDDLVKAATTRVETVPVVRTALNPLLWLTGIGTPLAFVLAFLASETWFRVALFATGALLLAVTIVAYFILLFWDPDRLQSEEYRLRRRELTMIYGKGASAEVVDAARETARVESRTGGFDDGGTT